MKLSNYQDAVTDCNWAVFLRPGNGEGYYLRAIARINIKDYRALCDDIGKARDLGSAEAQVLGRRYCNFSTASSRRRDQ
jgi:hypothetical protein